VSEIFLNNDANVLGSEKLLLGYCDQLKELIRSFCAFVGKNGISITPFGKIPLEKYMTLPEPVQAGILKGFSNYFNVIVQVSKEGVNMSEDSRTTAWWALKKMGYTSQSDFFSVVEKDDMIEFYNSDSIQVFRTLNMFSLLSYEWSDLFTRDDAVTEGILNYVTKFTRNELTSTARFDVPPHNVYERFSSRKNTGFMEPRFVSPLYDGGSKVAGFIVTFKGRLLNDDTDPLLVLEDALTAPGPVPLTLVPRNS
jgi:hypothetical protein